MAGRSVGAKRQAAEAKANDAKNFLLNDKYWADRCVNKFAAWAKRNIQHLRTLYWTSKFYAQAMLVLGVSEFYINIGMPGPAFILLITAIAYAGLSILVGYVEGK